MARRRKSTVVCATALYAWSADNKASRTCIRHFVSEAVERKRWAENVSPEWLASASFMSAQWVRELRVLSVHQIARQNLENCRARAGMVLGGTGFPVNQPEHRLWASLNGS
jgi:hypothetical protein